MEEGAILPHKFRGFQPILVRWNSSEFTVRSMRWLLAHMDMDRKWRLG